MNFCNAYNNSWCLPKSSNHLYAHQRYNYVLSSPWTFHKWIANRRKMFTTRGHTFESGKSSPQHCSAYNAPALMQISKYLHIFPFPHRSFGLEWTKNCWMFWAGLLHSVVVVVAQWYWAVTTWAAPQIPAVCHTCTLPVCIFVRLKLPLSLGLHRCRRRVQTTWSLWLFTSVAAWRCIAAVTCVHMS